jgi:hypothetical protein
MLSSLPSMTDRPTPPPHLLPKRRRPASGLLLPVLAECDVGVRAKGDVRALLRQAVQRLRRGGQAGC